MNGCKSCAHWSPRRNPEMAKQSFALCAVKDSYTFFAPNHTCAKHQKATPEQRKAQMPKRTKTPGIVERETPQETTQWWME